MCVTTLVAATWLVMHQRDGAIRDETRHLRNVSATLADGVTHTLKGLERVTAKLSERVLADSGPTPAWVRAAMTSSDIDRALATVTAALPQSQSVLLIDADGWLVNHSRGLRERLYLGDREYFRRAANGAGIDTFISEPVFSRRYNRLTFYAVRRLTLPGGRFGGVILGSLEVDFFVHLFGISKLSPGGSLNLWRDDGMLLARSPVQPEQIGRVFEQGRQAHLGEPFRRMPGIFDERERLISISRVTGYPLSLSVTEPLDEVLADLRSEMLVICSGALLACLTILGTVSLAIRRLHDQERLEQARLALQREEERRRADQRILHLAHHDPLTGLPNRASLRSTTEEALARARGCQSFAMLCLDLDHFKDVNDTLGHPAGDMLLCEVAARIAATIRDTDTVARLGGDEFAIVVHPGDGEASVIALATRLVEVIGEPYEIEGQAVFIGTSVGIAMAPRDGRDPDTLLKHADLALYKAKGEGRGRHNFFEPEMDKRIHARRRIEGELRMALQDGQLVLHYQPIVRVATRRVVGFEALMRWRHPKRGLVPPADFISIAEDNGLIVQLGEWALHAACREAAAWPGTLKVAVNLSAIQFRSRGLVQTVAAALARSGLAPGRLELEITETAMMHDLEATLGILDELKRLGACIVMDDFGTGHSSLAHLRHFPFDKVKIDRGFIRDIDHETNLAVVRAVTGIAESLAISTTVEGVETEDLFDRIARERCDEAQGYLFGMPVSAAEVPIVLARLDTQVAPEAPLAGE